MSYLKLNLIISDRFYTTKSTLVFQLNYDMIFDKVLN